MRTKVVCIAARNTLVGDKRTFTEAEILSKFGFQVILIGLRGKNMPEVEWREGICLKRIPTASNYFTKVGKSLIFFPVQKLLPEHCLSYWRFVYRIIEHGLKTFDRLLKWPIIYFRIGRRLNAEKADYYHAHFPLALMLCTWLTAKFIHRPFIRDYNDILVLELPNYTYKCYYEIGKLWGNPLNKREEQRISDTLELIPTQAKSILDVGCGDGRVANRISVPYRQIIGLDVSMTALRYLKVPAIQGTIEALPFKNKSFDLVLATEVIEHLPNPLYKKALSELKRVARKWILIGVPWKEQLSLGLARCPRCRFKFHSNLHHRSFNMRALSRLFFPEFRMIAQRKTGGERRVYNFFLLWIKHYLGGIWTRTQLTVCPCCGVYLFPGRFPERNAISKFCDEVNLKLKGNKKRESSHIIVLYERVCA